MRRIAAVMVATVAAVVFAGAQARTAGAGEAGYENYIVKSGDTLGGIAGRALGDPGRWRELLRENPQVVDPNMIYPGDTIRVPVPAGRGVAGADGAAMGAPGGLAARAGGPAGGMDDGAADASSPDAGAADSGKGSDDAGAAMAAAGDEAAGTEGLEPEPELPVVVVRPKAAVSAGLVRTAGYIADGLPVVAIVASPEGRDMLGPGDQAIINAPAAAGAVFTVVRADRRVFHPLSGQPLGWLVRVLGTAEVTCEGPTSATVTLGALRDAAAVGDYLVPGTPGDETPDLEPKGVQRCVAPGGADALIVAFDEDRSTASEQELVYIDRGTAAGVAPGTRFQIYRPVAPAGTLIIGELQVLKAGPETATALVTNSLREVQIADLLRME